MGNSLSGPRGDAGDAHRRDNGTGNPQNGWDYLRYLCCSSCSRLDESTGSHADAGSRRSSNSTADERQRLLTGEEPTRSQAGTGSDRSSDQRSEHSQPEELNQTFQAAKQRIKDCLERNPKFLDEKQKGTFEKIAVHLSEWITKAKEGIEMDCVSNLVENLDEMKLDSDLVKNLGEMHATIVLLDSRRKLNQTFQAVKQRIDDYLGKNPNFLDEGKKEAYKIAVDNLSEHMKDGELGIEMNDHISNLVENLNKISNIIHARKAKNPEQSVTDEKGFGRMRKKLDGLDGRKFEEMRQEIKAQKDAKMDKDEFTGKIKKMIEQMGKDEESINEKLKELNENLKKLEKFKKISENLKKTMKENYEDNVAKAREKLENLKKAKQAAEGILEDIESETTSFEKIEGLDSRMISIRNYLIETQKKEFEENRQKIKEQKDKKMDKDEFREKYEEMIEQMKKDEESINERLKEFEKENYENNVAKAREKLENLKKAKQATESILKDIESGKMSFGKIEEFDSRMILIRDYLIEKQNEEFDIKEFKDKDRDYWGHRGHMGHVEYGEEGEDPNKMADKIMRKWILKKIQGKATVVPEEVVLGLIGAVSDEKRKKIWDQWKSVGLDVSIDPITGEEISNPQPSSSASASASASASGTQVGRPRKIQFSED